MRQCKFYIVNESAELKEPNCKNQSIWTNLCKIVKQGSHFLYTLRTLYSLYFILYGLLSEGYMISIGTDEIITGVQMKNKTCLPKRFLWSTVYINRQIFWVISSCDRAVSNSLILWQKETVESYSLRKFTRSLTWITIKVN